VGPNGLTINNDRTGPDVLATIVSLKCGEKFNDICLFVLLILEFPVSSAQAERSFSTMLKVQDLFKNF